MTNVQVTAAEDTPVAADIETRASVARREDLAVRMEVAGVQHLQWSIKCV